MLDKSLSVVAAAAAAAARDPRRALGHPKGAQEHPKASQRELKPPKVYKKLPINRPSGRYVIIFLLYIYIYLRDFV